MKTLVSGAAGFIGHWLVRYLKERGHWVRAVDIKRPLWSLPDEADENLWACDLRLLGNAMIATEGCDEVYALAATMGGAGFVFTGENDVEIMRDNTLINVNTLEAARLTGVKRYFFSSSVCIYRDMRPGEHEITEEGAYPAYPDNEYGWEKLYAERLAMTYARHSQMQVRIARFQNCYGTEGTWRGGREKAPAALCRKVAEAEDGGSIEVWGDGTAIRSFIYVDDLVDAICTLMQSDESRPTNIGTEERVTVDELAQLCIEASGKRLTIKHVPGPVGVQSRNFSHERIRALGWEPKVNLREGIVYTYPWIEAQVRNAA